MVAELASKYTGTVAAEYESRRVGSEKWRFEQDAVERMLRAVSPRTVLDVPVGTGRFIPTYARMGVVATGADVSADMLAVAAEKGPCELVQSDVFGMDLGRAFDCVVCVRFLNWLSIGWVADALATINRHRGRYAILSVSTAPARHTRHTGAIIHGREEFRDVLHAAGMRIASCDSRDFGSGQSNIMLVS